MCPVKAGCIRVVSCTAVSSQVMRTLCIQFIRMPENYDMYIYIQIHGQVCARKDIKVFINTLFSCEKYSTPVKHVPVYVDPTETNAYSVFVTSN